MEKSEKQISTRQLILILIVAGGIAKLIIMPLILLKTGGRSAIISLGVFLATDLVQLVIMVFTASVAKDKTLTEILEHAVGRIASRIITAILLFYAIAKVVFLLSFFKSFVTSSLFENVMWAVYALPLFIILVSFGLRSLKSAGRLCEILFVFMLAAMVLLVYLISKNSSFISLFPIGSDGDALGTLIRMPLWFGDYILAALFLGKVQHSKRFKTVAISVGAVSAVIIFIAGAVIFSAYTDIAPYFDYDRKLSSITQITISGINAGRYDKLLFCIALSGVVIIAGLYFTFAARSSEYIIGLKKPYPHSSWILAAVLYVLSCYVFTNDGIMLKFAREYLNYFFWAVQIFMPLILLAAAAIGRKKKPKVGEVDLI